MAEWRAIEGWPGYEVSDEGQVRSWKVSRREPHAVLPRVLSPYRLPSGYLLVKLKERGHKVNAYIHHLVAQAFHGPRPEGADVAHWDGNKENNTHANLRYATRKENVADTVRLGRAARGERHCNTTITNEQAAEIKAFRGTHAEAAHAANVNYHMAYKIRMGLSWRWLGAT